jgi:hypothetical protein
VPTRRSGSQADAASSVHAVAAIELALAAFEDGQTPTREQLGDLADAIDAYAERSYFVAKVLAEAALKRRSRPVPRERDDVPSLSELRSSFEELRASFGHTRK